MRESLLDKEVMASTESPVVRMLPNVHVVKIGARSIIDAGKVATYPVVDVLGRLLESEKLILGVGGGARSRHVFSIGLDLGLPTGALAQFSVAERSVTPHPGDATRPVRRGAIPPEILGISYPSSSLRPGGSSMASALLALGASSGRAHPRHIAPMRLLYLGRCFGTRTVKLVKVGRAYKEGPEAEPNAASSTHRRGELKQRALKSLPFDELLPDSLSREARPPVPDRQRLRTGTDPAAVRGEHVGTIVTPTEARPR